MSVLPVLLPPTSLYFCHSARAARLRRMDTCTPKPTVKSVLVPLALPLVAKPGTAALALGRNIAVDRDAALHAARLGFAKIGVPKLGSEPAGELIAAEDLPGLVGLVAADGDVLAGVLHFRPAERAADVEASVLRPRRACWKRLARFHHILQSISWFSAFAVSRRTPPLS